MSLVRVENHNEARLFSSNFTVKEALEYYQLMLDILCVT